VIALFVLSLAALFGLVVLHDRRTADLIRQHDAEREKQAAKEARERWEIMTRLQAPALMATAPLAPPPVPLPEQDITLPEADQDDDAADQIGRILGG
jgi:hypothetical protein